MNQNESKPPKYNKNLKKRKIVDSVTVAYDMGCQVFVTPGISKHWNAGLLILFPQICFLNLGEGQSAGIILSSIFRSILSILYITREICEYSEHLYITPHI